MAGHSDVEGAEYELLPHLIRQGTLCHVTHLIVEWHLNAISPTERLAALGQRLALETTIRSSCGGGHLAPLVVNVGYEGNNEGTTVPGLQDVVSRHEQRHQLHAAWARRRWESTHEQQGRPSLVTW